MLTSREPGVTADWDGIQEKPEAEQGYKTKKIQSFKVVNLL